MRLLILNGPNLNLLGIREQEVYGKQNYLYLCQLIKEYADKFGVEVEIHQTNHEGVLVNWIQQARGCFDGIVLNPAAYTHTSIALLDAVKAVGLPTVEVHISNLEQRESFRRMSYVRTACIATISGHGLKGYLEAIDILRSRGRKQDNY